MTPEQNLARLALALPPAPKPVAVYRPVVVVQGLAYVSGHGPVCADGSLIKGQFLGARERKRRGEVSKAHARKLSFDEAREAFREQIQALVDGTDANTASVLLGYATQIVGSYSQSVRPRVTMAGVPGAITPEPREGNLPVRIAFFTSPIAWVISISLGQATVQLKTVWQRYTPNWSLRIRSLSAPAWSRLSKIKRCAVTIAAGPTYWSFAQKDGQEVVQQAHKMHLVVSSKRSRSSTDCSRSCAGGGSSLTKNGITERSVQALEDGRAQQE